MVQATRATLFSLCLVGLFFGDMSQSQAQLFRRFGCAPRLGMFRCVRQNRSGCFGGNYCEQFGCNQSSHGFDPCCCVVPSIPRSQCNGNCQIGFEGGVWVIESPCANENDCYCPLPVAANGSGGISIEQTNCVTHSTSTTSMFLDLGSESAPTRVELVAPEGFGQNVSTSMKTMDGSWMLHINYNNMQPYKPSLTIINPNPGRTTDSLTVRAYNISEPVLVIFNDFHDDTSDERVQVLKVGHWCVTAVRVF